MSTANMEQNCSIAISSSKEICVAIGAGDMWTKSWNFSEAQRFMESLDRHVVAISLRMWNKRPYPRKKYFFCQGEMIKLC